MPIKTFTLTLAWTKMLTENVKHFAFHRPENEAFSFIPGQFITLHLANGEKELKRSYSVSTIPGTSEYIEFAASYVEGGIASNFLFNLAPNEIVKASGPYGRLILKEEAPKRYILVATGTGVTPYRAMIPDLKIQMENHQAQVIVLFGVQTPKDAFYVDEFLTLKAQHPQFDFRTHYSRLNGEDLNPHEFSGYVQSAFPSLNLTPESDIIYLCGNPNMIDDAYNYLKEMGFGPQNVRREKYISAK